MQATQKGILQLHMATLPYQRVIELLQEFGESRTQLAQKLSIPQNTFNRYFCDQHGDKIAAHLWKVAELYPQVSREWLFFGEGAMLKKNADALPAADRDIREIRQRLAAIEKQLAAMSAVPVPRPAIPLVGFARCGVVGWNGTMPLPMAAELPELTPGMIAVAASGDSMRPAGISNGQICYCDPSKTPLPGEAVYVERKDGLTALKVFLSKTRVDDAEPPIEQTVFQGWLPAAEGEQKPYSLAVDDELIRLIAPVVLIRRRL